MSYTVTAYNVMIGSPTDVVDRELVEKILAKWNHMHGEEKKLVFLPLKWEDDSYPEANGLPPQTTLNQQLCERSDMLIAIFWTRLGTPTDEYESGTLEEISEHVKAGKQVFLYFCEKPFPKSADIDKLNELNAYRKKVEKEKKILYATYDSDELFEDRLLKHLDNMVQHKNLGNQNVEYVLPKVEEPQLGIVVDGKYEIHVEYETPFLFNESICKAEKMENQLRLHRGVKNSLLQEEYDMKCILHNEIPEFLKPFIKQKDLDVFYDSFKSDKDIEDYINAWRKHLLLDEAQEVKFTLFNDGPGIANDIKVEIEASDDKVMILDKETYEKMHKEFRTKNNPMYDVREKFVESIDPMIAAAKQANNCAAKIAFHPLSLGNDNFSRISALQVGCYISYRDDILTLHYKKLFYERKHEFSDSVYVVPLQSGSGSLGVTYSCDEYKQCKHDVINYTIELVNQ